MLDWIMKDLIGHYKLQSIETGKKGLSYQLKTNTLDRILDNWQRFAILEIIWRQWFMIDMYDGCAMQRHNVSELCTFYSCTDT